MSIDYLRVINSKGLSVISEAFEKKNDFYQEGSNDLEFIINNLYANLQSNFPSKLSLRLVEEAPNIPNGIYAYFFIEHYDLYIFFSKEGNLTEYSSIKEISQIVNERQSEMSFFRGVVVTDFSDTEGPVPLYNGSELEDDFLSVLAVQGTTVLGMGMTSIPNHIVGPVPIPANSELSALIRGFQRPAPGSEDPRIQLGGRPTTIFIIIEAQIILNKEILDFIDTFLSQWINSGAVKEFFDEDDLKDLTIDLRHLVILAQDLIRLRDIQTSHLKDLVKFYTSENAMLKQEIIHLRDQLHPHPKKRAKAHKSSKTTRTPKTTTKKKKK